MTQYPPEVGDAVRLSERDLEAYVRAEQMLDRYGVAYVIQHPEVLLGIAPGSSLYGQLYCAQPRRRGPSPHLRSSDRASFSYLYAAHGVSIDAPETLDRKSVSGHDCMLYRSAHSVEQGQTPPAGRGHNYFY